MISMLTYGNDGAGGPNGGVRPNPSSFRDESSPDADGVGAPAEAGLACLTSMVELQEREIVGLRGELSEALMRVPRTGGESALEETLRKQVHSSTMYRVLSTLARAFRVSRRDTSFYLERVEV